VDIQTILDILGEGLGGGFDNMSPERFLLFETLFMLGFWKRKVLFGRKIILYKIHSYLFTAHFQAYKP